MARTHIASGIGIFAGIAGATLLSDVWGHLIVDHRWVCVLGGAGLAFLSSVLIAHYTRFTVILREMGTHRVLREHSMTADMIVPWDIDLELDHHSLELIVANSLSRQLAFAGLCAGMSVLISPAVPFLYKCSPLIVPDLLVLSASTAAGCAAYCIMRPPSVDDSLYALRTSAVGGILGVAGLYAMASVYHTMGGLSATATAFTDPLSYRLLGGFLLLTFYESAVAMRMYGKHVPDHLGASVDFKLDITNAIANVLRRARKRFQTMTN